MFLYLVQVKVVLFAVISVLLSWLHPFQNCTKYHSFGPQLIRENAGIHGIDLAAMKRPAGWVSHGYTLVN